MSDLSERLAALTPELVSNLSTSRLSALSSAQTPGLTGSFNVGYG